ncbi:hypothetical protein CDL60_14290 [Roseateles noduli]|nr:hypothetical protein CDL60_14290 [Roseateles noduli]
MSHFPAWSLRTRRSKVARKSQGLSPGTSRSGSVKCEAPSRASVRERRAALGLRTVSTVMPKVYREACMASTYRPGGERPVGASNQFRYPPVLPRGGSMESDARVHGRTVLLVEDDKALRYALGRSLQHLGFHVLEAADGASAVRLASDVDAVVLDIVLPDASGISICEELRRCASADLVIVQYSGIAVSSSDKVAGLNGGADAYLEKPVEASVLAANLEAQLRKRDAFRKLSAELSEAREAELKSRDLFLSVLGHDMRGPLDAVLMSATLLLRLEQMSPVSLRAAGRVMFAGQRIKEMVDDLHDFAQVRVGDGLALHPAAVDLAELAQATVDEFSTTAPQLRLELASEGPVVGSWDRSKLSRLLVNLLRNAAQHGDPRQPIAVAVTTDGERALLEVRNQGEPISPELLPQVFDRMVGTKSPNSTTQNLGLGLFICKQISKAHGGNIEIESDEGGTVVRVELPLG